ncbi:alpha/beta hydrolase [Actinocorallia sp. A-T 12471]|uniref:alpha/beta hydrolase n=1 Tax=Actinocorallia sp. A-T 12471 TaxID=3089813 RepID=UPI0029CB36B7|nr:alpha/beta hydrolase fold domain-containing protein [Actinocorallia sp. A-T 12471]MDX6745147.1 alpha/beta hydrolase fold domain-containing protein [Actinocorallia sp. A-T 12471]
MSGESSVRAHGLGLTVLPRERADAVVLYLHGDRSLAGAPEPGLAFAEDLAARTGAEVFCAGYRPHFPEALHDARAAFEHCRTRGPVALAGRLEGAGLAAALLLALRDEGAPGPSCAVLLTALLDLRLDAQSLLLNAATDAAFDLADLRARALAYAAGTPLGDPLLSPLLGNLHGLPPVQLQTAGTDPLLDDSIRFAGRAARSGVDVHLRVRAGAEALHAGLAPSAAAFLTAWGARRA